MYRVPNTHFKGASLKIYIRKSNQLSPTIIVGSHVNCHRGMWENIESVTVCPIPFERVALEINTMDIHFCAQAKCVPHHMFTKTQVQTKKIPIHVAIHR